MSLDQAIKLGLGPPPTSEISRDETFKYTYSTIEPTRDIEDSLAFLAVPSHHVLQKMISDFGQAWLDRNKSIRTSLNPEIAKVTWLRTEHWLHKTGGTRDEAELKLQVRGIWSVVRWHETLAGFDSLPIIDLAKLFSNEYLSSRLVDAMLTLLALWARIAGDKVLIVGTTFAKFIQLLPPIIDGAPVGPINISIGGQKYRSWFQIDNHKRLYNILYRDPNHWTTSLVNFKKKQVKYGDGLKWKRLVTYNDGLQNWIEKYHGAEFVVSDNLMCAFQTDGFNCPIIAVNTIAHNEFGDALWTKEKAKAMQMKAFCDILKHSLSVEDQGSQPTVVDLTDLAENLLAVDVDINDELLSTVPMAMHTELPNSELQIGTEGVDDVELGIAILQSLHDASTAEHSGEFGETIKESVDTTRAPTEFGHSLADIEMQEADPIEPLTGRGFKRDVDQVEDVEECKGEDCQDYRNR
ncbi:hypothetical protein C8F04DRAFT_1263064 [Mycena alexandri]|uniref:Uncharacterized protein n=1 Tax=Mycena alexandri TaxID=1745969 RepID=A0AAD6SNL7_9AGAR|nr:hypothetical protein C8F04DRAFT_1263064 [Mycena alexandri]